MPNTPGRFSAASKILKYPFKLGLGTLKAFKEAIFRKKGGISKRVQLFAQTMIDSVHKVHKEKEKAKKKANKDVKKPIGNTMADVTAALPMDETLTDAEKKDTQAAFAEALRDYKKETPKETKTHAKAGFDKVKKNKDDLTIEEQLGLSATGIITLKALRKKFKTKAKFKKVLASLNNASKRSKFPVQRLLSQSLVGLFRMKDEKFAMKFAERLRLQPQTEATAKLLVKIGKGLSAPELDTVARMFKAHILKHTTIVNIKKFLKKAKKLMKSSKDRLNVNDFTEFVFLIDVKDYPRMIDAFTGKPNSPAKKGA